MKKLFYICLFLFPFAFAVEGCNSDPAAAADKQLAEMVTKVQLPQTLDDSTILTGCYYDNKTLTYRRTTSSEKLSKIVVDSLKAQTINTLKTNLNSKNLVSTLITAQATYRYICVGDSDSIVFTISPEELK